MPTDGGTLDDAYFEWLYSQIGPLKNRNPARNFWHLCRQLYTTEFIWFVPNDDNRVEDGKELRFEFLRSTRYPLTDPHGLFMGLGCSMFEMLVALSRLAAFESGRDHVEWFWRFMHNLELDQYTDEIYSRGVGDGIAEGVEETLERLNQRTYSRNGKGGLFPLRRARQDQREVELWYQMSSYLHEGHYVETRPDW
ncbi:hypothetical protein SEA_DIZZYRUDY_52 [Microbacterium phage DizzyRudy]|nr:hypothetical protein SEA_DIZZYRUDY_52 [Microbacterium phage DizzyRudy]WMI34486.1 hypothetical protein SEA_DAMASCUS_49 [Microbacterium phage Damascus]